MERRKTIYQLLNEVKADWVLPAEQAMQTGQAMQAEQAMQTEQAGESVTWSEWEQEQCKQRVLKALKERKASAGRNRTEKNREELYMEMRRTGTENIEMKNTEMKNTKRKNTGMKNVERKNAEMRNMGTRKAEGKKRSRVFWKGLAGAAAACMILVAAAGISNPVFARELFGHLFGRLAESSEGDKYEEQDRSLFQKLEEHAQRIEGDRKENGEKRSEADTDTQATGNRAENGEKNGDRDGNKEKSENMAGQENLDFRQSVTDQGATLSVTDAYCDGYILYYTAVLETDNEEFTQADGIMLERPKDDPNNLTIDGNRDVNYIERAFTKEADGRYITAMQVNLMGLGADLERPEGELVVDWRVGGFTGRRWDSWDEQGNYAKSGSLTGDWHLTFPVSIDISENQAFSIDKEENGILLKRGIITKAGLVLELELPDLTKEPYQLACSTEILVKDSNGERLQMLSEHEEPQEDGTAAKSLMVLYDGQKELLIEVIAKDEKGTVLAVMPFILQ